MGNFHCIDSSCATVRYQTYSKAGNLRYRYPGQDWILIDGDDYSITEGYFVNEAFEVALDADLILRGDISLLGNPDNNTQAQYQVFNDFADSNVMEIRSQISTFGSDRVLRAPDLQLINWELQKFSDQQFAGQETLIFALDWHYQGTFETANIPFTYRDIFDNRTHINVKCLERDLYNDYPPDVAGLIGVDNLRNLRFITPTRTIHPGDLQQQCQFLVFKDGEVIHQQIATDCPEVEFIDGVEACQLNPETQSIKIEKSAFLQRVEVRNQSIEVIYVSPLDLPLIYANQLPDECLNIYLTLTTAAPILSNFIPLPGVINPYAFQQQICSDVGCPPPQYEVICSCGRSCPDNTCPCLCNDHVCCHDLNTGDVVDQIALADYDSEGI